jgi:hypothetical protein
VSYCMLYRRAGKNHEIPRYIISCLSRDSKIVVPVTRRKLYAEFIMLDNLDITVEMLKYLLTSLLKWQQLIVTEII